MTTEFVYLPAKKSVRPEDPSNDEGQALLKLLAEQRPGFGDLIWSRSVDKPDIIGIGVAVTTSGFPLASLARFQASPPRVLRVHVNASDLIGNPVTEIAILPLEESLSDNDVVAAGQDSATFGNAILGAPAPAGYQGTMALKYHTSWAEGQPQNRLVMVIGWREVENHLRAAETPVFKDNLKPIAGKLAGDIDVTHFQWKGI